MIGLILDIGNIIFFLANLPQIITAFRNRKNLQGLSSLMLSGFILSTLFFITAGILTNGYFTAILGILNEVIFGLQLYWKFRCK